MNKIGIDIGSTNSKIAVLDENNKLLWTYSSATGFSGKKAADILLEEAKKNGYNSENATITATGYGRVSADFATKKVTIIDYLQLKMTQTLKFVINLRFEVLIANAR